MKDTPQVANSVIALLSVVYNWSKQNQLFKGDNPFLLVKQYSKVRVKAKLPDDKRDQIKDYLMTTLHTKTGRLEFILSLEIY